MDVSSVFFRGFGEAQDIINEYELVNHISEYVVHLTLEDGRSVSESKRHHRAFPVSRRCVEGHLPLIALSDAYQMVGVMWIQFGEDGGSLQEFEGRRHQGKRVAILDCDVVDGSIVDAWSWGSVLLPHEGETCSCRRRGRSDETRCEGVTEVFVLGFRLWPRQ